MRFDRYSPYFKQAQEYGLKLRCFDYYPMIYPFAPEVLERMAYYFTDHNYGADYIKAISRWFAKIADRVQAWRQRWELQGESARPQLVLRSKGPSARVYDSRAETPTEHDVSGVRSRLLGYLDPPEGETDERRRFYALTSAGRDVLAREAATLERIVEYARLRRIL